MVAQYIKKQCLCQFKCKSINANCVEYYWNFRRKY